MKFKFGITLIAFVVLLTFEPVEAVILPPNSFTAPPPSGICLNDTLAPSNGTQNRQGFCSSEIQGEIPNAKSMVSTIITFPENGCTLEANKNFTVEVKIININTGFFTDATTDYYDLPQQLGDNGFINGHSHIVIQQILSKDTPLDPSLFSFFKGLNDAAVDGVLSQVVGTLKNPGLPAGCYRLCTMSSSFSHQPVIMPVAQRGSQDDCIRFTVEG